MYQCNAASTPGWPWNFKKWALFNCFHHLRSSTPVKIHDSCCEDCQSDNEYLDADFPGDDTGDLSGDLSSRSCEKCMLRACNHSKLETPKDLCAGILQHKRNHPKCSCLLDCLFSDLLILYFKLEFSITVDIKLLTEKRSSLKRSQGIFLKQPTDPSLPIHRHWNLVGICL